MRRAAAGAIALTAMLAPALALGAEAAPPGAVTCSGCHGLTAETSVGPPLRGRSAVDIAEAMAAYRAGERQPTVMDRIAKGFDPAETRAIARWIAGAPKE